MKASQFIAIVERDLGLKIALDSVRLGRLFIEAKDMKKDNGYVCFYTVLCEGDENSVIYVKSFKGKTERCAKKIPDDQVSVRTSYRVGDSFRAFGTTNWYYVNVENGILDYEIINEYLRKQRSHKSTDRPLGTTV